MILLWVAAGLAGGAALARLGGSILKHPVLERGNYRGHRLPTAAGLLLVITVVAIEGPVALILATKAGDGYPPGRAYVLAACTVFGFLGLIDDLLGDGGDRGLKGHVSAALHGRLTTGFVKLGGGAAAALVIAGSMGAEGPVGILVDGAVISLAANLGNLLDRAPGRTIKWGVVAFLALPALAATPPGLATAAVAVGAAVALLAGDLREKFMLGDTGANALGAAVGCAAVLATAPSTRIGIAGGLLALTLASEVISFGKVIDRFPPLRAFDRMGRLPAEPPA